ncbi:MAG: hypothetical protein EXX96DRAFT_584671 [Benjaminiella poitrasii]|nr:MAG: hypothetical protein EXX96DRAFT_584671 [Benjaminiella poitrasii]
MCFFFNGDCTSTHIKIVIKTALYKTKFIERVEIDALEIALSDQEEASATAHNEMSQIENMEPLAKMNYLCEKFGNDGTFDLGHNKIPSRFRPFMKNLRHELKLNLQPCATTTEREMLIEISMCKNKQDIDDLLEEFYKKKDLGPICKYIRQALANAADIWASKQLSNPSHNEFWFRTNVYSFLWDRQFLIDDKFISKRAECYSNTTKQLSDVENQRVDFILHDINDDNDYVSVEEKPS